MNSLTSASDRRDQARASTSAAVRYFMNEMTFTREEVIDAFLELVALIEKADQRQYQSLVNLVRVRPEARAALELAMVETINAINCAELVKEEHDFTLMAQSICSGVRLPEAGIIVKATLHFLGQSAPKVRKSTILELMRA